MANRPQCSLMMACVQHPPDAKVGARGNDMDYLRVLLGHLFNNSGRVVGGMIVDNENIILEIGLL